MVCVKRNTDRYGSLEFDELFVPCENPRNSVQTKLVNGTFMDISQSSLIEILKLTSNILAGFL